MCADLPRWDLTTGYPGLESTEYLADFADLKQQLTDLGSFFDLHQIEKGQQPAPAEAAAALEGAVERLNRLAEKMMWLRSYITLYVSTDSRHNLAQARQSELHPLGVRYNQLSTRLSAWLGGLDISALTGLTPVAQTYAYMLQLAQDQAKHLMSPGEEDLAAELNVSAGSAWGRLYNNLTSQLSVPVDLNGEAQSLPMPVVRNLAYDASAETRRAGYTAELAGWQQVALPLAAALNGIKGEVITLAKHRGWREPLDWSLESNNHIDRPTLEAMHSAVWEYFPVFRRYLQAKARLLGLPALPWADLFAPVGQAARPWDYASGQQLIIEQFGSYSARMGQFARRAFSEGWIDAEPRTGKRDGAFCMAFRGEVSRVFSNFQPGFKSVLTLAHELGHAYHNFNLARQPMLNRSTPMVLAETASIFCETITRQALLKQAPAQEQLMILEGSLMGATQVVVDVTSRFIFEREVFARRQQRELSIGELNELMLDAQRQTYGDGLDANALHPSMWAAKQHYYATYNSFYNYPYTFGLLFGLGLYARYLEDAPAFTAGYDELLASTGVQSPLSLAQGMGIDIRSPHFWRSSLATLQADVERFEVLAAAAG